MKRRANKSHKVPNVKLRPAAPGSSAGRGTNTSEGRGSRSLMKEEPACWAQETQETAMMDTCPRPFKGVVLCATGISDKPTLFKQALELGATSNSAFTSSVTHLLAADHSGAKYWCAVERQIPVLRPSWITESYQVWLRGDDIDFEESVENHKLPIFSGVVLSLSGIMNSERQIEITRKLRQNDGAYSENLERPVKVTHILCSSEEETEKMRYARKFNQRGEANIHILWEEWFWESLEFGGRFNEAEYSVEKPKPQRRIPIVDEPSSPRSTMHEPPPNQVPTRASTTAQYEEEEIACVAHRPAMTIQIWGSLLKNRGYEISNGKVIKSPSKLQKPPLAEPTELNEPNDMDIDAPKAKSIISTFRRTNSFAPVNESSQRSQPTQRLQPFRRTASVAAIPSQQQAKPIPERNMNAEAGPSTIGPRRIFSGLRFRVLGEARSASVRSAIEQGGGIWVSEHDVDDDVDYIIVRLVSGSKLYREEHDELERSKYRTECWLERCLSEQAVCPYQDHITFLPLNIQVPVAGTENIVMSFSGLHQDELCWLTRLLRALGIQLATAFSKRTTHLLCPSGTGPKYEKAKEWNTPVVSREWLMEIATTGTIPSVSEYTVVPSTPRRDHVVEKDPAIVNIKGKGKADDNGEGRTELRREADDDFFWGGDKTDIMMNDITNGRVDQVKHTMNHGATRIPKKPSERQMPVPTQQPEPPDTRNLSFGHPKRLLGGGPSQDVQAAVYPTTPTRRNGSAPQHPYLGASGFGLGEFNTPPHFHLQGEEAMETIVPPIPSSKTPSPMKLPQERSTPVLPPSPMKIDLALQESVTSLLGKRQVEDESGRHGKRSRPRRGPMSKQSSASSLNFDIRLASEPDAIYGDPAGKNLDVFDSAGMGRAGADVSEELMEESGTQEKSAWVMYEDPGQADERKKLMMLLKNPIDEVVVPNVRKGRRKSARIAAGA